MLIAGGGEKVNLRQVARYANASNFGSHEWIGSVYGTDAIRRKYGVLRRQCDALGRADNSVLKTYTSMPVVVAHTPGAARAAWEKIPERVRTFYASSAVVGTTDEVIAFYRPLVNAGVRYVIACVVGSDFESLRLLAEQVVPQLQFS
jgi:alkanesulfonate monooxygenase SsuD/methylene tetrahydromethanopterin reductase-like flavin-dependent oxidoreductase (luciferase family)